MITLTRDQTTNGAGSFTLVVVGDKKFLCPRWIEVPMDTEMKDVTVLPKPEVPRVEPGKNEEWKFTGSKGNIYTVAKIDGKWSCSCPAASFQRFKDCKHVQEAKKLV